MQQNEDVKSKYSNDECEDCLSNDTETLCALAHLITDIIRELPDVLPF